MSCSTTEMKALSDAAYAVSVGGADLDGMAHALRRGYDKGRREYLDQNSEVRAAIIAAPDPENEFCGECGTEVNSDGEAIKPDLYRTLMQAAADHTHRN